MLQSGEAPPSFRQPPRTALPMPISHPLVRPRRAAAARTNAAIDASLRAEAQRPRARLGKMKKNEASDAGLLTGSENPLHSLKVECCVDHVLLPCRHRDYLTRTDEQWEMFLNVLRATAT